MNGDLPRDIIGLVRQAQAGDAWALDKLLEQVRPRLERWTVLKRGDHIRSRLDVEDLRLRRLEGLSEAETARRLGITTQNVGVRLSRAITAAGAEFQRLVAYGSQRP